MAREGEDGGELCGGGGGEIVSWFVPDLPLLEKPVTNLRAQVRVPWEHEVVGRVALCRCREGEGLGESSLGVRWSIWLLGCRRLN